MKPEAIEDFKEDALEKAGQPITVLVQDMDRVREYSGTLVKARKAGIQIQPANAADMTIDLYYEHIIRFAWGYLNLTGALETPDAREKELPNASARSSGSDLRNFLDAYAEKLRDAVSQADIEPCFRIRRNLGSYELEKKLRQALDKAEQNYNSAMKTADKTRLPLIIESLETLIPVMGELPELFILLGVLRLRCDQREQSLELLQKGATQSGAAEHWRLVAKVGASTPKIAFGALGNFLKVAKTAEDADFLAFVRAAAKVKAVKSALAPIADFVGRTKDKNSLVAAADAFAFLLAELELYDEARKILDMKAGEEFPLFPIHARKLANRIAGQADSDGMAHSPESGARESSSSLKKAAAEPTAKIISRPVSTVKSAPASPSNIRKMYTSEQGILISASGASEITGYIDSYDPVSKSGYIKPLNAKNQYENLYFTLDHVQDENIRKAIAHKFYNIKLSFATFVNAYNSRQATRIKAAGSGAPLKREYIGNEKSHFPGDYASGEKEIRSAAHQLVTMGKKEKAINLFRDGLKRYPDSLSLLDGLAGQLMALGEYKEALETYKKLLQGELPSSRRKHYQVQSVMILTKEERFREAGLEAETLLKLYPDDVYIKALYARILAQSGQRESAQKYLDGLVSRYPDNPMLKNLLGVNQTGDALDEDWEAFFAQWEQEGPEESLFLKKDLESADFTDEIIIAHGSAPTLQDAKRLFKAARNPDITLENSVGAARQAAKAYSILPHADENAYRESQAFYAAKMGESLAKRMRGKARNAAEASLNAKDLVKLCDSATSYFTEAFKFMTPEMINSEGENIVRNYLIAELLKFYSRNPQSYDGEIISYTVQDLFRHMLNGADNLFSLACHTFFAWGGNREAWARLRHVRGVGYFPSKMQNTSFRNKVKGEAESLIGAAIESNRPQEIIGAAFRYQKKEMDDMEKTFKRMIEIEQTSNLEYFKQLKEWLDDFPFENKTLQNSDVEFISRVKDIIDGLMDYGKASNTERGAILTRARLGFEGNPSTPSMIKEIDNSPTYWKRSVCEILIARSLECLRGMDAKLLALHAPELTLKLEPAIFRKINGSLCSTLIVSNGKLNPAKDARVFAILRSPQGEETSLPTLDIGQVDNGRDATREFCIPLADRENLDGWELELRADYMEGNSSTFKFTVEEDRGISFTVNDIPWRAGGDIDKGFFRGRGEFLADMKRRLSTAADRAFSIMLFGVTRSGKTLILKYFTEDTHGAPLPNDPLNRRFFCINWDFSISAIDKNCTSESMWRIFLYDKVTEATQRSTGDPETDAFLREGALAARPDPARASGADLLSFVEKLKTKGIYPVFQIDEFSHFSRLHDFNLLGRAFLSTMRQLVLNGDAALVVAGTYDVLAMVQNPAYGITGQFANMTSLMVTRIKPEAARELVNIWDKVTFTKDACELILRLTDNRPYYIQYLCRECAKYAQNKKRNHLGSPEVNEVARMLTDGATPNSPVTKLDAPFFKDNLIFYEGPACRVYPAVISLIAMEGNKETGFMSYKDMVNVWDKRGLNKTELVDALDALKDREVIEPYIDDGMEGYRLRVELFRRWWLKEHPALSKELDSAL